MPDPSLSTGTLALFAIVGASWGAVLLAWLCQRLTGCPPPPQTPPLLTASPAEREPLLPKGDGSEPQRIPGLDEANGFLFFCAILASIGMGLQSFNGNFTAVSLALDCTHPGMATALNCQLKISEQMVSVYAAVPALASIPGAFIGGAFVDRVGRKRIMLLACVPFVAGWLLTALAPTPPSDDTHQLDSTGHVTLSSQTFLLLFAGRVLLGFGGGLSIPGIGPWITESAPSDLRGAFATLFQVLAVSGIAVMYVFGLLLRWRGIAISGAIMCTVYILLLTALPESPRWLLARGREAEALAALRQLRTPASDVDAALSEMKAEHDAEQLAAKGAGVAALLRTPATRKAMLISMGLMTLQNLSGVNAVFLFLGDLLQPIFKTPNAANLATLPVAGGLISFTLLAAGLMDRAGRVKLLLVSTIGMALSAAVLGLYFHLDDPKLGWLALSAVVCYFAAFSLGVGPIPWILASEFFPPSSRGTANSIATITMFVGAAVTTKLLPDMKRWLGLDGLFWFYSCWCVLFAVFTVCFVPETKGKSADDILRAM